MSEEAEDLNSSPLLQDIFLETEEIATEPQHFASENVPSDLDIFSDDEDEDADNSNDPARNLLSQRDMILSQISASQTAAVLLSQEEIAEELLEVLPETGMETDDNNGDDENTSNKSDNDENVTSESEDEENDGSSVVSSEASFGSSNNNEKKTKKKKDSQKHTMKKKVKSQESSSSFIPEEANLVAQSEIETVKRIEQGPSQAELQRRKLIEL
jgi:cobalamin biosynthesis protein CobT